MEALDLVYFGVGFATPKEFQEYDERSFGTWKFFQHVMSVSGSGELIEETNELEIENCFAYIEKFSPLSETSKRIIGRQDVRSKLKCVDKNKLKTL